MRRPMLAMFVVLLISCGQSDPGHPKGRFTRAAELLGDDGTPLTEEQKVRWEKIRKEERDGKKNPDERYCVAGLSANGGEWKFRKYTGKGITWDRGRREVHETGMAYAKEKAALFASDSDFTCTAIVDLYSKEGPDTLLWFYDDSKGAKETKTPPKKEWGESLAAYLLLIQKRPD